MENKTSKYFKYAIGEIILVVIGILIALQINNWNENRKDTIKEKQLLNNLQVELKDNLADLDSVAREVDTVIIALEKIFSIFSPIQNGQSLDSLDNWLSNALHSPNWRPSEYLLNNLSNSGGIAELKNNKLKLLLYKWSRQRNEMLEIQIRSEETGEEIIAYMKQHGSLRNVDVTSERFNYKKSILKDNNDFLLSSSQFENCVDDKLFMYKLTQTVLKEARNTLIQLINETND